MHLSAVVITKNEEDNIERCLKSLAFADEIILVDSESNDDTVAIAKRLGARTFVRPWPGYGPQKNFGAAQAQGDWLLFLDADEEITGELAEEIKTTIQNPAKDFYWLKIITIFLGKPLNHLTGHNPRLFKKASGSWTGYHVHEQVQMNTGTVIKLGDQHSQVLKSPLHHHSHQTVAAYLKRMAEYTALDAQRMAKNNKHRSGRTIKPIWYLPYYEATRQFLKMYVYKKGILDGLVGLKWSALSAYYEFVAAKKYLRITRGLRTPHDPVLR